MSARIKNHINAVSARISRSVFGNTNQLTCNFAGAFEIAKARSLSSTTRYKTSNQIIADKINSDGISYLENFYDQTTIKKVRDQFLEAIEQEHRSMKRSNRRAQKSGIIFSRIIKDIPQNLSQVVDLVDAKLIAILQTVYRAEFQITEIQAWRNYHIPSDIDQSLDVFSNRWHMDNIRKDFLKLFILISDVGESDGPLHVMTKARTREIIRNGYHNRKSYGLPDKMMDNPEHVVQFTGSAGSVMFCQTPLCLHKAGNPIEGNFRDIIQINFQVSRSPLPKNWMAQLPGPDLDELYQFIAT
jgi:hypothetical protein